jgi:murein DD-endopeptidase MepM/ murein hydrolase activator NlpD
MQIMITAGTMARTRVVQIHRWQMALAALALTIVLMLLSGLVYHLVLVKAAEANWPVVSRIVGLVVRDEMAQRERFMRENLDAFAQRVGEMQAKLVKLEAVGDRVSGMAGVKPEDVRPVNAPPASGSREPGTRPGQGGPYLPAGGVADPQLDELDRLIRDVDQQADLQADRFLLIESRLLERRLAGLLVPSSSPVANVPVGSGFGFRFDPFTGRPALHTGLDFPADVGTPILAAAGGVVVNEENHPAYGRMVEVDHGRGLVTRYAHASRVLVKAGDIVRRGQTIAEVGSTGRSTGPHLHFEVLVDGVPQNPARFLAAGTPGLAVAGREFAPRPALTRR